MHYKITKTREKNNIIFDLFLALNEQDSKIECFIKTKIIYCDKTEKIKFNQILSQKQSVFSKSYNDEILIHLNELIKENATITVYDTILEIQKIFLKMSISHHNLKINLDYEIR